MKFDRKQASKKISVSRASREAAIREKYRSKPSLKQLVESGDVGEPIRQRDYLQLMQLCEQFRERREKLGLSLAQLNKRSGIDRAALSRLENGQVANPTMATISKVAHALQATVKFVLEDDENKNRLVKS